MRRAVLAAALALAAGAPPLGAQVLQQPAPRPAQSRALAVQVDAAAGFRAILELGDVLAAGALAEAVRSGIPLRLRATVELWHGRRFFDELTASQSWSTVLLYEPLEETFALREPGSSALRRFPSYEAAAAWVGRTYPLALRPPAPGSYYYTARIDIETLSLTDLQELEHWLRGELRPAVSGESSLSSALTDGMRRLFVRVLGMPSRRVEARSPRFDVP